MTVRTISFFIAVYSEYYPTYDFAYAISIRLTCSAVFVSDTHGSKRSFASNQDNMQMSYCSCSSLPDFRPRILMGEFMTYDPLALAYRYQVSFLIFDTDVVQHLF